MDQRAWGTRKSTLLPHAPGSRPVLSPIIHPVYHAAMVKGPLIENPARRRLVIAVLMGTLLAASLGAAWLITGATLGF